MHVDTFPPVVFLCPACLPNLGHFYPGQMASLFPHNLPIMLGIVMGCRHDISCTHVGLENIRKLKWKLSDTYARIIVCFIIVWIQVRPSKSTNGANISLLKYMRKTKRDVLNGQVGVVDVYRITS